MAFIDYKQLRSELSFPTVLSHYNITHNASLVQEQIACPFHNDDRPSCSINKHKGLFNCFACDAKGNVLRFVCLMQDLDDQDKEQLAQGAEYAVVSILGREVTDFARSQRGAKGKRPNREGTSSTAKRASSSPSQGRASNSQAEPTPETEPVPSENKPLTFTLKNLHTDHSIFSDRGLSPEEVETFGLGICTKGIMENRLVFPIHNGAGELVAYAGRWLGDNPPENEGKYKLPKGFSKQLELFNQHRARPMLEAQDWERPLLIVEGYWSAIRLHSAGYPVVATFAHSMSVQQAEVIADMTEEAIIIYDGDEAGRAGAIRSAGLLAQYIFVRSLVLEDGVKPDVMDLDLLKAVC